MRLSALTSLVAVAAALTMGMCALALVRRSLPIPYTLILGAGVVAAAVSVALALLTGALSGWTALSLAAGIVPTTVPLIGVIGSAVSGSAAALTGAAWAGVVVPVGILAPPLITRQCSGACVLEDFAGGLPLVVGAGAFLVVPSGAPLGRIRLRAGTGSRGRDVVIVAVFWVSFVLWLVALEGAIDDFTAPIAAAAVLAPAFGAVGWVLADRIRGVEITARRAVRLGLLAGMGGILPGVASVTTPWTIAIGLTCGVAGALVHDSTGLRTSPPAVRAAVSVLVVGTIGMLAPGVIGTNLGFAFAARFDVIVAQFGATLGMTVLGVVVSALATLIRRRPRGEARS